MENNHLDAQVHNLPIDDNQLNQFLNDQSNENLKNQRSNDVEVSDASVDYNQVKDVDMQSSSSSNSTANESVDNQIDNTLITSSQLADCLTRNMPSSTCYILIDSRSFIEYNSCHIQEAINLCCSKIIKRRLQTDKVS